MLHQESCVQLSIILCSPLGKVTKKKKLSRNVSELTSPCKLIYTCLWCFSSLSCSSALINALTLTAKKKHLWHGHQELPQATCSLLVVNNIKRGGFMELSWYWLGILQVFLPQSCKSNVISKGKVCCLRRMIEKCLNRSSFCHGPAHKNDLSCLHKSYTVTNGTERVQCVLLKALCVVNECNMSVSRGCCSLLQKECAIFMLGRSRI